MRAKRLVKKLKKAGITKAILATGASNGKDAVFLAWDGDEAVYTGGDISALARFEDSNLSDGGCDEYE